MKQAKFVSLLFLGFIFGTLGQNILTPDQTISENENRPLQQQPIPTFKTILSGEYMADVETYITDQFFAKNWWVGLKSDMERLFLKPENNGVYFGKDGYLLEALTDEGRYFHQNLDYLNIFHEKMPHLSTTVLLAPTATEIYREHLPAFAPVVNQVHLLAVAKNKLVLPLVNIVSILRTHQSEGMYYKTDHHWTTLGAFYAYETLMSHWGIEPQTTFETEVISDEFYGTYYSKANNHHLSPDSITLYHSKEPLDVTIETNDRVMEGFYDFSYLDKKDKYSMFLGGNQPLTVIKTSLTNGKKLAIFKDSYAHSLAPFLAHHFEEIHLIDLRYFNVNPYDYLQEHGIEEILFIYNLSTFGTESSLTKFKAFSPTGSSLRTNSNQ